MKYTAPSVAASRTWLLPFVIQVVVAEMFTPEVFSFPLLVEGKRNWG